jgi:hypothetical protein
LALKYPFVLAFLKKNKWLKGDNEGLLLDNTWKTEYLDLFCNNRKPNKMSWCFFMKAPTT